ncbi:GmrSD restriction endonuclease domain-containing protein [Phocoenobacter skyensis]|uniref:DUF262 domain-containing protein n=1 Tax=Phocoenobacter skyensis TaxID=97481 RepID=A0A1H7V193_9PAST|nr:DUF262 domain-containing protein [Pasteurella skyensis]MDP8078486.1 DUF262 domain-containing protein [Pasteurella skyensis]MDP8084422.1 DUF262 domain-containing protein [Pasteurella skyensis]MDP8184753.1 DUF262 domain-containing protein [Pasteurella skyensis]QLB23223.1 hypothetical protein A6B44_08415 [Pasteurella skyensis]SEM02904.1 hypothetical protein SAMN05444853_103112 [Pasteurella skyensis]
MQKYSVNQYLIETVLSWVKSNEIAIPEIQRPFVWNSAKVRDLMDSLYKGYPIGYIIAWRNPNIRLKDGSLSEGKKVLIDGQQRITALTTTILDQYVINKNYNKVKIKISFNPIEERFEVQNPAILKDKTWIHDISKAINGDLFEIADKYFELNPEVDKKQVQKAFANLINIPKKQIGFIELAHDLDIETVTEIFIRINSKGVVLSQADFAMSKIAADTDHGGNELRKAIDYFCHLAIKPEFYQHIVDNDPNFYRTNYCKKMQWLKSENEDLYNPDYNDLIRVAFTSQFNRGRLSDLVSLLSGRNFETRTFEYNIAKTSFESLKTGVENFINENNFKRFLMIIKSAGFISPKLIRSQNSINFAYILYLKLKELHINSADIESYVKRWFVYSILTGRYSGSSESLFDFDIKQISEKPFPQILKEREDADLSDAYWNSSLPQSLNTSVASSPYFNVYLASQVKFNDKGFLSKDISVNELISLRGDIHHIFPKDYLKKNGINSRGEYNQIANYALTQSEINVKIGNKPPKEYLTLIDNSIQISGVSTEKELLENLKTNCIPHEIREMTAENFNDFLIKRRKLMANKIKEYYFSL